MAFLYVAAAHKSSGKTSVSVGLAAALSARGHTVQAFKKGPDFIDPLWLARATGRACFNLDFFTQSKAEIQAMVAGASAGADINLVEGNKGLFDGVDVEGTDSNAALACMLGAPVVLVIDTGGMTRGIAPLIQGYMGFDPDVDIRGVILNKVGGERHEAKLRNALERYTDAEIVGALGRDRCLEIPERHLGLVPANESSEADAVIARLSGAVASGVDLARIMAIADTAGSVPARIVPDAPIPRADVRIAIARDSAFSFYYPDDLRAFALAGAELVPFDTLHDDSLPDVDGLFIGGGFPETHLQALSANKRLRTNIRRALTDGMPAYAECGGLMYLSRSIQWRHEKADMAGVIPADVIVGARPEGRGYMVVEPTRQHPWMDMSPEWKNSSGIAVHEFHYARLTGLQPPTVFAHQVTRGTGIDGQHDGLVIHNLLAGFAHHRNTAANPWVGSFVEFVRKQTTG